MTSNLSILKRLYVDYSKNYIWKIILSGIFSLVVAGSTAGIAYLLDPAIKKIFIEKDQKLILIIPAFIILAFFAKGVSLYLARVLMISVGNDIKKDMQDTTVQITSGNQGPVSLIGIDGNFSGGAQQFEDRSGRR